MSHLAGCPKALPGVGRGEGLAAALGQLTAWADWVGLGGAGPASSLGSDLAWTEAFCRQWQLWPQGWQARSRCVRRGQPRPGSSGVRALRAGGPRAGVQNQPWAEGPTGSSSLWTVHAETWSAVSQDRKAKASSPEPPDNTATVWGGVVFVFFAFFLRAVCAAYESSQARGRIGAPAASLHHSHSHAARSGPHLRPPPQLPATPGPQPAELAQESNQHPRGTSWVCYCCATAGTPGRVCFNWRSVAAPMSGFLFSLLWEKAASPLSGSLIFKDTLGRGNGPAPHPAGSLKCPCGQKCIFGFWVNF